jgi:uncharacterized membrane protein YfcA
MEPNHIAALLATGLGVGFACGLLGIGGCFIFNDFRGKYGRESSE